MARAARTRARPWPARSLRRACSSARPWSWTPAAAAAFDAPKRLIALVGTPSPRPPRSRLPRAGVRIARPLPWRGARPRGARRSGSPPRRSCSRSSRRSSRRGATFRSTRCGRSRSSRCCSRSAPRGPWRGAAAAGSPAPSSARPPSTPSSRSSRAAASSTLSARDLRRAGRRRAPSPATSATSRSPWPLGGVLALGLAPGARGGRRSRLVAGAALALFAAGAGRQPEPDRADRRPWPAPAVVARRASSPARGVLPLAAVAAGGGARGRGLRSPALPRQRARVRGRCVRQLGCARLVPRRTLGGRARDDAGASADGVRSGHVRRRVRAAPAGGRDPRAPALREPPPDELVRGGALRLPPGLQRRGRAAGVARPRGRRVPPRGARANGVARPRAPKPRPARASSSPAPPPR